MNAFFGNDQHGINVIFFFAVLTGVSLISTQMLVRYVLRDSARSEKSKRSMETLAAALVTGVLGIIMLVLLAKMK